MPRAVALAPSVIAGRLPAVVAANTTSDVAVGSPPASTPPAWSVAQLVLPALEWLQTLLASPRQ